MRKIERYVMGEVLRTFVTLITICTALFVFVAVFGEAQALDLGIWQALQIMPYFVPCILPYTIPAALLLTVCVVYGRIAGDCELIAVRAAGIHIMHLMWPSFFVAIMLSIVAIVLTDQVIPWAFGNIERIVAMAIEDIFLDKLRSENQINQKDYGITISVTGIRDRTLIHPTIRYAPRGGKTVTAQAKKAWIEFDLRKQIVWLRLEGMRGNLAGPNQSFYSRDFEIPYALPNRRNFAGNRGLPTQGLLLSIASLRKTQTEALQRTAVETAFALSRGDFEFLLGPRVQNHKNLEQYCEGTVRNLRTEYYNRFSMSVSCFFVVLLGTPFSILMAKKQFLTTFLFCFLPVLTIYYPIAIMTQNLSKSGHVDPVWASWLANATLAVAGLYYIARVTRN